MLSNKIIGSFLTLLGFSSCDFLAYQEPGTRGRFPGIPKIREIATSREISRTGIPASHPYPQPEHVKSSIVAAFLSMFKEVNLWPFTFQGHQIKFFRCENIAKGVRGLPEAEAFV